MHKQPLPSFCPLGRDLHVVLVIAIENPNEETDYEDEDDEEDDSEKAQHRPLITASPYSLHATPSGNPLAPAAGHGHIQHVHDSTIRHP